MRKLYGIGFATGALLIAAATTGTAHATTVAPSASHRMHPQRVCAATPKAGFGTCYAEVLVPTTTKTASTATVTAAGAQAVPRSSAPPAGALTPSQLQDAYKLGTARSGGRTVAIVDAYGYPNLERDLKTYRTTFGLPACTVAAGCLRIVNQTGGASLPSFNAGWAGETALDVDAVSAACPDCKIVVVQAKSASMANLGTAAKTAAKQAGVVAISNSYGGGDESDSDYGSYYQHSGVAVTASTGDDGYEGASYPASSSYVTAVGGTSLTASSTSRGWTESAWNGSGSGCSSYNTALSAAASFGTGCGKRAMADVSAAADPGAGGLAVYYPTSRSASTWAQVGGTSESSPIIAAVYALSGDTTDYANAIPYQHSTKLFDVTSGANGSCSPTQMCKARSGWDGPTGLGTPDGTGAF